MKLQYIIVLFLIISSCTSIKIKEIKDKETYGKILFKNLKKKSESIDNVLIEGMIKINGVKDIPSAYIKCQILCQYNKNKVNFKLLSLI